MRCGQGIPDLQAVGIRKFPAATVDAGIGKPELTDLPG